MNDQERIEVIDEFLNDRGLSSWTVPGPPA